MAAVRAQLALLEPWLYTPCMKQMPTGELIDKILGFKELYADRAGLLEATCLLHGVTSCPGCLWWRLVRVFLLLSQGLWFNPLVYRDISKLPLALAEQAIDVSDVLHQLICFSLERLDLLENVIVNVHPLLHRPLMSHWHHPATHVP